MSGSFRKLSSVPPNGRGPTASAMTDEMRYKAQDAMRTIARAEDHKRDPELMGHVRTLADDVRRATRMRGTQKTEPAKPKNPSDNALASKGVSALKSNQKNGSKKKAR